MAIHKREKNGYLSDAQLKIPTKKYTSVHEINLRSQETAAPIVHTFTRIYDKSI